MPSGSLPYVALLRGVNVGGKSIVAMAALKTAFEAAGVDAVRTYINSGNVIFASSRPRSTLQAHLERAIAKHLRQDIRLTIRDSAQMSALTQVIPETWVHGPTMRCNVLFLWDEIDSPSIVDDLPANRDFEELLYVPGAVVWRFDAEHASRSRINRLAGTPTYKQITIRNVNTVRALHRLMTA